MLERNHIVLDGYTTSDLRYTWEKDTPVQIPNDIIISTHGLVGFTTEQCDSITKTGTTKASLSQLSLHLTKKNAANSAKLQNLLPHLFPFLWHMMYAYIIDRKL